MEIFVWMMYNAFVIKRDTLLKKDGIYAKICIK